MSLLFAPIFLRRTHVKIYTPSILEFVCKIVICSSSHILEIDL
ncbi:hypothetical protein LEP1GSC041_3563 [Leptospira noguchii str. 2006001870]|uniref:Uncharacterized protein n=1 Tax=Leptospira noguchii serovar Autumnalis str. ZUN142 TaxID=1085540 RepID=M6U7F6_9LEPT|nr:hypothetical protein LEP1GSC041_3563 [Leptospira noguchii str. 2006001870]EMO38886.1 hypothetical protein LEP1GSC186_0162 [Leptospira noguchii serovar Autumnalis str. ZUN142]